MITQVKFQQKMAEGMWQHRFFSTTEVYLVSDGGQEISLKDYLERTTKLFRDVEELKDDMKTLKNESSAATISRGLRERSGAV